VLTDARSTPACWPNSRRTASCPTRLRFALSVAAFNRISQYDGAISDYLSSVTLKSLSTAAAHAVPGQSNGRFTKVQDLRYGENPHQQAACTATCTRRRARWSPPTQLQGKELSYNNIADADAAWECVKSFDAPACVIVKHANPCGVAVGADALQAYSKAFQTDPTSAFGGIIAFNRTVDGAAAEQVSQAVRRGADGARLHAEALEVFKSQGQCAPAADRLPQAATTAWDQGRNAMDMPSASARACCCRRPTTTNWRWPT
jgi:phosphoribosylaminoimidazolecarboxamide formyltransferase/IMP cyclohydrolase